MTYLIVFSQLFYIYTGYVSLVTVLHAILIELDVSLLMKDRRVFIISFCDLWYIATLSEPQILCVDWIGRDIPEIQELVLDLLVVLFPCHRGVIHIRAFEPGFYFVKYTSCRGP